MRQQGLDFSVVYQAIASLDGALSLVEDTAWFQRQPQVAQDTLLAGTIQNLEFVYDLSVKTLRRQLERVSDTPGEIDRAGFRDILRIGGKRGLVDDVGAWFRYRDLRNASAHTYEKVKVWKIYRNIPTLSD